MRQHEYDRAVAMGRTNAEAVEFDAPTLPARTDGSSWWEATVGSEARWAFRWA